MDRKEFTELMDDYIDGELSSTRKKEFEDAMVNDAELKAEFANYKTLINEFKSMDKNINPPSELFNKIESEISGEFKPEITMYSNNVMSVSFDSGHSVGIKSQVHKANKSWYLWSSAAVALLAVGIFMIYKIFQPGNSTSTDGYSNWQMVNLTGNATVNGVKASKLNLGDVLETDGTSSVVLKFTDGGNITIEPNSKIRLVTSDNNESRVEVISGTVNTDNKIKPGKIVIEANNVKVRDNGANYTFNVDDKGNGIVYVKDGKVSFVSNNNRQAYIPEGNFCYSQPDKGVGTPFRKDSKPEFQQALFNYDFGNNKVPEVVYSVLANANVQDAYSLVNLLPRLDENKKFMVFNKLSRNGATPSYFKLDSIKDFDENDAKIWIDDSSPEIKMKVRSHLNKMEKEELKKEMDQLNIELKQMNSDLKLNAKQMAEDMKKEMKELQIDLKELNLGLKDSLSGMKLKELYNFNNEDWKEYHQDMEEMHKELSESFKDMGKDFRELGEDMREQFKDMGKDFKVEIDTAGFFKSYNSGMDNYMQYYKNFDTVEFHQEMKELDKLKDLKVPYFDADAFKDKFKDFGKNFKYETDSNGFHMDRKNHKITIKGDKVIVDGDTLKKGDRRNLYLDDKDDEDKDDDKDKDGDK